MGDLILLGFAIIVFVYLFSRVFRKENHGCGFDCKRCPFPPCDKDTIRRMKNDLHNR